MSQTSIGIFAHVDAGKTTLCEAILYTAGVLRKLGRVDHQDSWFDTFALERKRGITIFSKQATFSYGNLDFTILDTPGHVDFAAEAERIIPVIDFAVIVISGPDGIQPHTETLWKLLEHYHVPALFFVTKMDTGTADAGYLKKQFGTLSSRCIDLPSDFRCDSVTAELTEEIAAQDSMLMDLFFQYGTLSDDQLVSAFYERRFFPVLYGSGLRLQGIPALLEAFMFFRRRFQDPELFGAIVYKITHDPKGVRLTHLRVQGGILKNRDTVSYTSQDGSLVSEKVTGIRVYNSNKYSSADCASASVIVAVSGLSSTYSGQGLGASADSIPVLEPVLRFEMRPADEEDPKVLYQLLLELQEEEPQLRLSWDNRHNTIFVRLMGNIQTEILKSLIWEKYKRDVIIGESQVLYKETISAPVEGIGHFEPLRHYAEVHLLMEPCEPGSGLMFGSVCPTDRLASSWQNLILYHLQEKRHIGVLGGFPLTDVRITLTAGRISLKHTEGGDIREASLRAVRQGLMKASNVLLEPFFRYTLTIPTGNVGRAVNDIQNMTGSFSMETLEDGNTRLTGLAPVSEMQNYAAEVASYTGGYGKLTCVSGGYFPCHNTEAVLAGISYDPEADLANTPNSVFCRHGAGFTVHWDEVGKYQHLDSMFKPEKESSATEKHHAYDLDEKELEELMLREFGPIRRRQYGTAAVIRSNETDPEEESERRRYLIIDGYNLMFALAESGRISSGNLDLSRTEMLKILSDYSGFTGTSVLTVFDAYQNKNADDKRYVEGGVSVFFTDSGESADAYIERTANQLGKNDHVRVVSSDNLVRLGVFRSGIQRTSSQLFLQELEGIEQQIRSELNAHATPSGQRLGDLLPKEVWEEWHKKQN